MSGLMRRAGMGLLFLCLLPRAALGETITRPADGITRVQFRVPGELVVRKGDREQLTVEAEPQVLKALEIGVKNDTLTLAAREKFKTDKKLLFTLTVKSLRSIRNEGSGNASAENFSGPAIDLDASGSGNLSAKNLRPEQLNLAIRGSGNIDVSGAGKAVAARIDGSGTIDAANFRAQSAQAEIKGSGDIRVHADETLKASIGGAGSIRYRGKPRVTQSVTGAGGVDPL